MNKQSEIISLIYIYKLKIRWAVNHYSRCNESFLNRYFVEMSQHVFLSSGEKLVCQSIFYLEIPENVCGVNELECPQVGDCLRNIRSRLSSQLFRMALTLNFDVRNSRYGDVIRNHWFRKKINDEYLAAGNAFPYCASVGCNVSLKIEIKLRLKTQDVIATSNHHIS